MAMGLTSCASIQEPMKKDQEFTNQAKSSVRFISESEAKRCKYLGQQIADRKKSPMGMAYTENSAKEGLLRAGLAMKANALRITDRQILPGKGKYNRTRLYLYANYYKCP